MRKRLNSYLIQWTLMDLELLIIRVYFLAFNNFIEFIRGFAASVVFENEEFIKQRFTALDKDKSGKLSKDELQIILQSD